MIKWITNFFENIKINSDYLEYEKNCLIKYTKKSEILFPIQKYKDSLSLLENTLNIAVEKQFSASYRSYTNKISNIKSQLKTNKNQLNFFKENYKQALEKSYNERQKLFDERSDKYAISILIKEKLNNAHDDKKSAYVRANEAKDCIDSWYNKSQRSTFLLGNSGQKIPKSAFFSQSHNDLDSYKHERSEAYAEVEACKEEINAIKYELNDLNDTIKSINNSICKNKKHIDLLKCNRTKRKNLMQEGYTKENLEKNIALNLKEQAATEKKLEIVKKERSAYSLEQKNNLGFYQLENKLNQCIASKQDFLDSFKSEVSKNQRKITHRTEWLKKNT